MRYILYIIAFLVLGYSATFAQENDCYDNPTYYEMGYSNSNNYMRYTAYNDYSFLFQENAQNNWTIGPNPTYGEVNVYGYLENISSIELYSITGEMLQLIEGFDVYQPLDLYAYKSGIYLIRIISLTNEVKTYKVIKR
ncbi:MAG: T9SS type A sorting domain-containing protein [Bacteroidetes bacterium]|nr:T9SS type A sorting domain-containing protein [Bacteroidota bacterium]